MKKEIFIMFIFFLFSLKLLAKDNFWVYIDNFEKNNLHDFAFNKEGDIYCGNPGLYKSTNDGLTWIYLGLEDYYIDQIIIDDIGYIYIDDNGRLLISKDDGKSCDDITYKLGMTINGDFFMNKRGYVFIGQFFTKDHGDSFLFDTSGIGEYNIYAINSEGHIFRGGSGHQETICRSTDDGDTWEVVFVDPNEWPKGVVCSQVHNMIFSQTDSVGYACGYKTTNNGRSWYINRNLEDQGWYSFTIDSLAFIYSFGHSYSSPAYYKTLYKRIKDSTWEFVDTSGLNGVDEFNTIATSPNGYLYLAAHNGGLYRSRQAYVSAHEPIQEISGISLSPNPASDYIDIRYDNVILSEDVILSEAKNLKIYNSLGECVLTPIAFGEGPGVRLDISTLPPGLYNCILSTPKFMESVKFIIVR